MRSRSLCLCLGLLAAAVSSAFARVEVEAVAGRPFGVAYVMFTPDEVAGPVEIDRLLVNDSARRALYPALQQGVIGKLFGALAPEGGGPAGRMHLTFLFRGDEPFDVQIETPGRLNVRIVPTPGRRGEAGRLMARWWTGYQQALNSQTKDGDVPPLVKSYLLALHAGRMGLQLPADDGPTTETQRSLELMIGMEAMHDRVLRQTMLGPSEFDVVTDQPLPPPVTWPELGLANVQDATLEPIARHVPAECFYVRFGKFSNYLWMDDLIQEYSGNLGSMITLRGQSAPISQRGEKQLGLEKNAAGKLFGDSVIADVALIGRDTFLREGGAFGVLFQAKNSALLRNDLSGQQKRALGVEKENGASLEIVKIAGHDVSFLSTPDNRLRSFYAADGDFHLVTTSRAIVERFYEAGAGRGALADTAEFRNARQQMPLSREDTIFAYFSTAFFEGLLSPQYQIELHRRMQAITDLELVYLAQAAAAGEGVAATEIPDLVAAGFLPQGFGRRPGGSGPLITEKGMLDSLRGPRGTFIPVPDVKIEGVTKFEADRARIQLASFGGLGKLDPWMVGVRRFALDDKGRERIHVDAHILPLDETKFGKWASMIGPPTTQMILPLSDDAITVQAGIRGGLVFPHVPPHIMFVGVKDLPAPGVGRSQGLLGMLQLAKSTPGYLGAWPKPGFMDMLPFGLAGRPDPFGFSQVPLINLWRWQGDAFSVLSFDPNILVGVAREVRMVDAEIPAQVRAHAGDLSQSQLTEFLNSLSYQRSLAASKGNAKFMHLLVQQFHTPLEQAKVTAERLIDAKLICPLGGEYAIRDQPGDRGWVSSKWTVGGVRPPEYQSPLLGWFRGADLYLRKIEGGLFAHAELDMQRKPVTATAPKLDLAPLLNFDLFGGSNKAVKPKEEIPAPAPDAKTAPKPPPLRDIPAPPKAQPPLGDETLPRPREF